MKAVFCRVRPLAHATQCRLLGPAAALRSLSHCLALRTLNWICWGLHLRPVAQEETLGSCLIVSQTIKVSAINSDWQWGTQSLLNTVGQSSEETGIGGCSVRPVCTWDCFFQLPGLSVSFPAQLNVLVFTYKAPYKLEPESLKVLLLQHELLREGLLRVQKLRWQT